MAEPNKKLVAEQLSVFSLGDTLDNRLDNISVLVKKEERLELTTINQLSQYTSAASQKPLNLSVGIPKGVDGETFYNVVRTYLTGLGFEVDLQNLPHPSNKGILNMAVVYPNPFNTSASDIAAKRILPEQLAGRYKVHNAGRYAKEPESAGRYQAHKAA